MKALFAGSFNPPTLGHIDIIERSLKLFDFLYVAIMVNPEKRYVFTARQRAEMLEKSLRDYPNVKVLIGEGLTAELAKSLGADTLVRGVRGYADFDYEMKMADINRSLFGIETVILTSKPELGSVSSSAVIDIAKNGGSISAFVPNEIVNDILTVIKKGV